MVERASREVLVDIRRKIQEYFSEEAVRTLCFDLGVEYDDLPASGRAAKVRELVSLMEDNGRLPELLDMLHRLRPNVDWPELTYATEPTPITEETGEPDEGQGGRSLLPYAIGGLVLLCLTTVVIIVIAAIAWPDNGNLTPTRPEQTDEMAPTTEVPNVVGLSLAAAEVMLAASDLRPGNIIEEVNEAAPGTVLRSQPVVGTEVQVDTRVHLIIATEPEEVATEVVILEPDLEVIAIELLDRDTVRCRFQNVGDGPVPRQEILLVIEVKDDRISSDVGRGSGIFPLDSMVEGFIDVDIPPVSESVDARCIVDDTDTVAEADEANNELVRRLEVSEQQVRLESIVFEDGRITNEGVVDNGAPYIGDYPDNTAVRGFLSFDLSDIPAGAEILEASLRLGGGRPDWKGNLVYATHRWLEIYDYAYGSLDPGDYNGGLAERVTGFDPQKLEPIDVTELVQEKVDTGAERLQLRLQMSNETDNDGTGDRVGFLSSDLVVTYWIGGS